MDVTNKCYLYRFEAAREFAWSAKEKQLEYMENSVNHLLKYDIKCVNKDFRTLHLDFGRRTGNTFFIINKCVKLAIIDKRICFCFFINLSMAERFWKLMEEYNGTKINRKSSNIFVYTFGQIKHGWQHIPNSYAFVDVSCMMGEREIDRIMESDQWEIISLL
jgi:hypothetical protein